MERRKFIYLAGLIPVIVCCLLQAVWMLTAAKPVSWLGLLGALLMLLFALFGCLHAYQFYHETNVSDQQKKLRRKDFLGHTIVLSLGLVFSFQSLRTFQSYAFASSKNEITLTIKNTSDQPVRDLHVELGMLNQTIKEIPARGEKELKVTLLSESRLLTYLGNGKNTPQANILVGPGDHTVLLRIDYQQNLLPEVN